MKKKIALLLCVLAVSLTASAQFEKGKKYVGASLTGLDINYSGLNDFSVGLGAQAGYLIMDNIMLTGSLDYRHDGGNDTNSLAIGAGGRYYIIQNGIYLGANVKYVHDYKNYNDIMPGVEVGYAFFINHYITIEPAIYYQQSFKDHSDYSKVGLKVGIGIYL